MGYIFVSYSRKQLYFAESVALKLQQAGLEIWFDLQKLEPGMDWAAALKDGYGNCEKLVLIASQAAIQSPYVQVEWETALQNGREVTIVLTEPLVLPETLRNCAVFDARRQFDQTIDALIPYLQGEAPARHDPVPAAGRSVFRNPMPFDVRLTAGVMLMPAITAWVATLSLALTTVPVSVDLLPESIEQTFPALVPYSGYLLGFVAGLILAFTQYPVRDFLQHSINHEELSKLRRKLFMPQLVACALCLVFTVGNPRMAWAPLLGYSILVFPLVTAYWSFWTLKRSPDLLRWMPSGEADQEVRETVQREVVANLEKQIKPEVRFERLAAPTYAVHAHPADRHIAALADSILKSRGCTPLREEQAAVQLMIVSNRTSKQWLLERNASLPGPKIHVLATNINTPPEIQPLLQTQWIDFRNEREKVLQSFATQLTDPNKLNVSYAMEISPTGFDNSYAFPRSIRILLGASLLLFIVILVPVFDFWKLPDWAFIPVGLPLLLYIDGLIMRRYSLPAVFYKLLGKHVAWFAEPAPHAADAIGNTDRNYITDKDFLLLVDVLKK
jgi:hypothetical protein